MLSLLFATLLFSPAAGEASSSSLIESPERDRAVEVLEASLESGEYAVAASEAADLLGDGWRATAKLRRIADEPGEQAEIDVKRQLANLRFKPLIEAPLPPGWPTPTAVGEVEIKTYPQHRLARTSATSGSDRDSSLFYRLFNHIQAEEIPMTTPVEMTGGAAGLRDGGTSMSFLYPNTETGKTGRDGMVEVVDVPEATYASFGLRGGGEDLNREAEQVIRDWLKDHPEWAAMGETRVLGYNSPMVPGSMRYSEVQVRVEPAEGDAASADPEQK